MKSKSRNITKDFTYTEWSVLKDILFAISDVIDWDEDHKQYSVGERVIFTCGKREYNAIKKLNNEL